MTRERAEVAARQETGAAHLARHRLRKVEQLNVEGEARIDGRVLMQVLRPFVVAVTHVIEVMVKDRAWADQALDSAAHQRQGEQPRGGALRGGSTWRAECRRAWAPLVPPRNRGGSHDARYAGRRDRSAGNHARRNSPPARVVRSWTVLRSWWPACSVESLPHFSNTHSYR